MRPGEIVHLVSRGAFWLSLEKVAAVLSGLAYSALLLRWLGPTKFGIMTLALVCTGVATMATGNLEMYLERYAAEYTARRLGLTLRRAHLLALAVKLALGLVASALLLAVTPALARFFEIPDLLVLVPILTITVVFDAFSTTGRATMFGTQQFRWVAMIAIAFHVAKTVMVGMLWWARQGLVALAVGLAVLTVILALVQAAVPLWHLRRSQDHEPFTPERTWGGLMRGMWGYCMPLLCGRITFMSGQHLSKVILGKLFDTTLLGYFTFAYQTVERFTDLVNTVPTALLPSFTRLVARGEREKLRSAFARAQRLIQTLGCVASLGLFLFARELTLLIASPLFEPAIPILRVLALVPIARTAQQPLTMLFQSLRRPGTVLALALVKFVAEFGSYFLLVTTLGIIGAAWANLTGAVLSYLAALMVLDRFMAEGARERVRTGLVAAALLASFIAVTLLIEWQVRGHVLVLFHLALLPVMAAAVFAVRLVRQEDLDKLAAVPLERAWTRLVRGSVLAVLNVFARLGEPRRAA
jgi:O-antigen/teichoic acid export membrane protein